LKFVFQPRCRVLVGINESGKSNILQALSFLDPEVELEPGDLREIRPDEKPYDRAYVHFVFKLHAKDKAQVLESLRRKVGRDLKNYNFSDDELTDCTPTDLNDLVAQEFHAVEERQLPTVIFWRYDENQLLPGKINISQFSADPESCAPLKHMFELSGISDIPET